MLHLVSSIQSLILITEKVLVMILTPLNKKEFESVLKNYSIGRYLSHKHLVKAVQNTVYVLNTTQGQFVLKVFELIDQVIVQYQFKIINYLAKKNMPVQKFIHNKNGEVISLYKHKPLTIETFLKGKSLKKPSNVLLRNTARTLGKLDRYLLHLTLQGKYTWGKEHLFKNQIISKKCVIAGINIKEAERKLLPEMNSIDRDKLRKSVIHSDFRDCNVLVKNNRIIAILDWGDCHEDYLAYELAVTTANLVADQQITKRNMQLFFAEYQKYVQLRKEEQKATYYFIKRRFIAVILWFTKQMRYHKDLRTSLAKTRLKIIQGYIWFSNISLAEFLDLFHPEKAFKKKSL
ncbi:MAG: phosphotransferase [Candidatus Woesearchaeota archaeon]|nr:phosphotransferase [Candidatus Woesearchaeota archaeon]